MGNIGSTIELKQRKLREEIDSENPRQKVVKRLEESISRHKKEMKSINKGKRDRRARDKKSRRRRK